MIQSIDNYHISIGFMEYEEENVKSIILKITDAIDKIEEYINKNQSIIGRAKRFDGICDAFNDTFYYYSYSSIGLDNKIDPLNFIPSKLSYQIISKDDFNSAVASAEKAINYFKEMKEEYSNRLKLHEQRLKDIDNDLTNIWDRFYLDIYENFIDDKEALNNLLTPKEEKVLSLRKYTGKMFHYYYDLTENQKFNQDEAADLTLIKFFGKDYINTKKASLESFIKRARTYRTII